MTRTTLFGRAWFSLLERRLAEPIVKGHLAEPHVGARQQRALAEQRAEVARLPSAHWRSSSVRHMLPGPRDELTCVRFFEAKDAGDLAVGIVERLSKHVCRAFRGRELLEQQEHREAQRVAPLGPNQDRR
jgi:hypothetical protein